MPCRPVALAAAALVAQGPATAEGARTTAQELTAPGPAHGLMPELVLQVLRLVPHPPWVAWSMGGQAPLVLLAGARHPAHTLNASEVDNIHFLAGAARVLTVSRDVLTVWESGRPLHEFRHDAGPQHGILHALVFPDGRRVATVGSEGLTAIWSTDSGDVLARVPSSGSRPHTVARALGDDLLATGVAPSLDSTAVIWSARDGRAQRRIVQPRWPIRRLEASPCGKRLLTSGSEELFVWSVASGRLERSFEVPVSWSAKVAVARDGAVVMPCGNGELGVFYGESRRPDRALSVGPFNQFVLLPRGDRVFVVTRTHALVWDIASGKRLMEVAHHSIDASSGVSVSRAVVSATGDVVAACGARVTRDPGGLQKWMVVWDGRTGLVWHRAAGQSRPGVIPHYSSIAVGPMASMAEHL